MSQAHPTSAATICRTFAMLVAGLAAASACNSAHEPALHGAGGAAGVMTGGLAGAGGSADIGGAGGSADVGGSGGSSTEVTDGSAGSTPSVDATDVAGPDATTPADAGAPLPLLATAVAVGANHSCALLEDHTVKCWGDNADGDLGYGDTQVRGNSPAEMGDALPRVDLGTGRTAIAIAASRAHTCAILDDGSVKCWGAGPNLGLPDTMPRGNAPGQMGDALPALDLGAGRRATQLAAGYDTSCALLDDGSVKCWGDKDFLDSTATHMLPRTMSLGTTTKVRALLASGHGVSALLEDGKLVGELPTQPAGAGMIGVAAFAGARQSRCALLVGGGSKCTSAAGGQLPATTTDLVAVGVGEDENVCAIKKDGSVRCWGFSTGAAYWHDGVTTGLEEGLLVLPPDEAHGHRERRLAAHVRARGRRARLVLGRRRPRGPRRLVGREDGGRGDLRALGGRRSRNEALTSGRRGTSIGWGEPREPRSKLAARPSLGRASY